MRGTQDVKEIRVEDDLMIHVQLWYGYEIILNSEETGELISNLTDAMLALEAAKRSKNSS